MQAYIQLDKDIDFSTLDLIHDDIETYIFTENKIYKKYKKHFFEYDINRHSEKLNIKNKNVFLEKGNSTLNKKKIITTIPYNCYFVNRQVFKYSFNDNIIVVKEIDNDIFKNIYFEINNMDDINNLVCL